MIDLRNAMNNNAVSIYEDLKQAILTFQLMPGEIVSENNIAAKYGTSRTTIRPILKRLEDETLLHIIPQKGSFVTYLDYDYIKSIMFIRLQVEYEILRRLTIKRQEDILYKLEECVKQEKMWNVECVDAETYFAMDSKFHRIIYETLPILEVGKRIEVLDASCKRYRLLRHLYLNKTSNDLYEEHSELLENIRSGNPDTVFKCFKKYIYGDIDVLAEVLGDDWNKYFLQQRNTDYFVD